MGVNEFLKNASKAVADANTVLEVNIEDDFVTYAKSKGFKALKLILLRKRGFPDRTVIGPGATIFFIEFKKKGKKLAGTQHPIRRLLHGFGFGYYVCDRPGQAEKILNRYISKNRTQDHDKKMDT